VEEADAKQACLKTNANESFRAARFSACELGVEPVEKP
jgi:hypothetical protein